MTPWVLFSVLAFLVFGVPLIDDVYRLGSRRAASHARQVVDVEPDVAHAQWDPARLFCWRHGSASPCQQPLR